MLPLSPRTRLAGVVAGGLLVLAAVGAALNLTSAPESGSTGASSMPEPGETRPQPRVLRTSTPPPPASSAADADSGAAGGHADDSGEDAARAPATHRLVDIDGRALGSLEAPADGIWNTLFFVRSDCPISNQYAPEIKRICSEYGAEGTRCILVYTDRFMTEEDVRFHLDDYGYTLPAILDSDHELVEIAGATITPEVAVFTEGAALRYRGRIDNLYADLGRPRQVVTEHELRDALDDLAAGRGVRNSRTQATGCYIE